MLPARSLQLAASTVGRRDRLRAQKAPTRFDRSMLKRCMIKITAFGVPTTGKWMQSLLIERREAFPNGSINFLVQLAYFKLLKLALVSN